MKKKINQAKFFVANTSSSSIAPKVLLVDDDVDLTELLGDYLKQDGFAVTAVHNAQAGIDLALQGYFDIAVLDLMIPGDKNGADALKEIRGAGSMPLIVFTAKGDDIDRIIGLEQGADDYIPKPCTSRELAARIRAVLRRNNGGIGVVGGSDDVVINGLSLSSASRSAAWNGQIFKLTSTEFSLLLILAKNVGVMVDKSILSQEVLGRPASRYDRCIDVHISSIRRKLDLASGSSMRIETVFGRGYQLLRR